MLSLWETEVASPLRPFDFEAFHSEFITDQMREKLVFWLIDLCDDLDLHVRMKELAIYYIDIVLSKIKIQKENLQLLGITALLIATKVEGVIKYTLQSAQEHANGHYSEN